MVEKGVCGECKHFELLRKDGYGKCTHPKASWPNEKGHSGTWSDNRSIIVLDVSPKGKYVYCFEQK